MINKELLILVCIFSIIVIDVYSKPTLTSGIRHCYKQECPENTFACERLTRVSEDKKHIVAEIHCLDVKGNVHKNVTTYEENPYSPSTDYKGYSYQGAFEISTDNESDEYSPKESHGIGKSKNTESELEDLNKR